MAKYNLSSDGRNTVNCDILNESEGKYIVRFENGSVSSVDKKRVHSLNSIDEGVLDTLRGVGEKVSKYGKTFVKKVQDTAKAIKDFFVKAFKMNGFVFFKSEDDEVINASHPINAMIEAKNNKSLNVFPSSSTIDMCREVGIEPRSIENFQFTGQYEGVLESVSPRKKSGSVLESLFEREGDYITGSPIEPKSPMLGASKTPMYKDVNASTIVKLIVEEYEGRLKGDWKALPYFIWGAPGIGKTEIITSIIDILEKKHGERPGFIAINARTISSESFSFPASIMKGLSDEEAALMAKIKAQKTGASYEDIVKEFKEKSMETAAISDLPKDWMPVYNPKDPRGEEYVEMARKIANGGKINRETGLLDDGPGGFIFIDEYARMNDDAAAALMQLPSSRYFKSKSQTIGNRWVVIAAANRKNDIGTRNDYVKQDAAMNTRWQKLNFVPSFDDWKLWAEATRDSRTGQKNIHPDILAYIKQSMDEGNVFNEPFGDFYNMTKLNSQGEQTSGEPTASPRSWESASEIYYSLIDEYGGSSNIPDKELEMRMEFNVGAPVAKRFVEFLRKFKFTNEDARAVWTKGRVMPATEKSLKGYINTGNFENFMMNFVLPKLEEEYPNAKNQNGISPENLLNAINFIEFLAPQKTGGNGRLDSGILRKIFKVLGTDIAGVELLDYDNDGSQDLYAEPRNKVADILMSNDSAA